MPTPNNRDPFRPNKDYFNMPMPQALKTWTVMETILAATAFGPTPMLAPFV